MFAYKFQMFITIGYKLTKSPESVLWCKWNKLIKLNKYIFNFVRIIPLDEMADAAWEEGPLKIRWLIFSASPTQWPSWLRL